MDGTLWGRWDCNKLVPPARVVGKGPSRVRSAQCFIYLIFVWLVRFVHDLVCEAELISEYTMVLVAGNDSPRNSGYTRDSDEDYERYGLQNDFMGSHGDEDDEEEVLFVRDSSQRNRRINSVASSASWHSKYSTGSHGRLVSRGEESIMPYGGLEDGTEDELEDDFDEARVGMADPFEEEEFEGIVEGEVEVEQQYSPTLIFLISYFVTIATILGTGILGLPVKLTYAGFGPFVTTFTICVVMQVRYILRKVVLLKLRRLTFSLFSLM